MTRETSIEAWREISGSRKLGAMQQRIMSTLRALGPMTGAELDVAITGSRSHYHKRLPELRDLGLLDDTGVRTCKISGRRSTVWSIRAVPLPAISRRGATRQELEQKISELMAANAAMRIRIAELELRGRYQSRQMVFGGQS